MKMKYPKKESWVRLSHVLGDDTPAYGGGKGLAIDIVKSMNLGDTCNSVDITLSNHLGSHVDSPRHFVKDGATITDFLISEWVFEKPYVVDIPAIEDEVITVSHFEKALDEGCDADLLLVRTGFESRRNTKSYWAEAPAFDPVLAEYLSLKIPSFKAIGLDSISISSLSHREMGREAHQAFLRRGIRIFEDLSMTSIPQEISLKVVIALPLLIKDVDGAPCTIIGLL